jgi:hypothetical protein
MTKIFYSEKDRKTWLECDELITVTLICPSVRKRWDKKKNEKVL